jgi:hypothetical protein
MVSGELRQDGDERNVGWRDAEPSNGSFQHGNSDHS